MHYSFGLGVSSLNHRRREEFPAIFTIVKVLEELMKELSVFIDESGDFGEITERPAYYLVTLLFHDQKNEIASNVKNSRIVPRIPDFILNIYIRSLLSDKRKYFRDYPLMNAESYFLRC